MTQRLRDNQALRDEVQGIVWSMTPTLGADAISAALRILDAVDRALTATGPGSGALAWKCKRWCGGSDQVDSSWWDGATSRHFCSKACLERSRAPQTDHRAAPAPTYSLPYFAAPPSGSPPAVTEPMCRCGARSHCGVDEGHVCDCAKCSPSEVTELRVEVDPITGEPLFFPVDAPVAAPGEPVTSGSPPGAAERRACVHSASDHHAKEGCKAHVSAPSLGDDGWDYCPCNSETGEWCGGSPPGAAGTCQGCNGEGIVGWGYGRSCSACDGTGRRPPESPDGSRGTR